MTTQEPYSPSEYASHDQISNTCDNDLTCYSPGRSDNIRDIHKIENQITINPLSHECNLDSVKYPQNTNQNPEWPTVLMISCKVHECLQRRYSKQDRSNNVSDEDSTESSVYVREPEGHGGGHGGRKTENSIKTLASGRYSQKRVLKNMVNDDMRTNNSQHPHICSSYARQRQK